MKIKDFEGPYIRLMPNRNNTAIQVIHLSRGISDGQNFYDYEYVVVDGEADHIARKEAKRLLRAYFIRKMVVYVCILIPFIVIATLIAQMNAQGMSSEEEKTLRLIMTVAGVLFAYGFSISCAPIPDEKIPGARVDIRSFPHLGTEINDQEREILLKAETDPDLEFQNEIRSRINQDAKERIAARDAHRKTVLKERVERHFKQT